MLNNSTVSITVQCDVCGKRLEYDNDVMEQLFETETLQSIQYLLLGQSGWIVENNNIFCPDCDGVREGKTIIFARAMEENQYRPQFRIGKILEIEDKVYKIQSSQGITYIDISRDKTLRPLGYIFPLLDFEYTEGD